MLRKESLWRRLKRIWKSGVTPDIVHPEQRAKFRLIFKDRLVGTLMRQDGQWSFQYSEEFKQDKSLRTITEFPDVEKVYRSTELWPFFHMRIPSLRQARIRTIVENEHLSEDDEAGLLTRFGRKTVANPFELINSN